MLTIQNLKVFYHDYLALDVDQTLAIEANDRVGIVGSNGAGKSTFIKACLGMVPYQGEILTHVKPEQIAVHMQSNEYVDTMKLNRIMETILDTKINTNKKLQELIDFFDFAESLKKKYKELSGGQKQRFTLIMVLMQEAPLTFFDEVTTGLDFETRQALMKKIIAWYEHQQGAILFVTHYYEELEQLTNKLLILDQGKVVAFGLRKVLFERYCGHSVITFKTADVDPSFLRQFKTLKAPGEATALSCASKEAEMQIIQYLNQQQVNFKRSDSDVEILVMNAIAGGKRHDPSH